MKTSSLIHLTVRANVYNMALKNALMRMMNDMMGRALLLAMLAIAIIDAVK